MDRVFAMVCSVLLAAAPTLSEAWRSCGCDGPDLGSEATAMTLGADHGCCGSGSTQDDQDQHNQDQDDQDQNQDKGSDQGCECPLGCCGNALAPIAPPARSMLTFGVAPGDTLRGFDDLLMGSPNLHGLKRPPRPVITL